MAIFIFDLDGTLLNTMADIAVACNTVLGRHNYPQHPISSYAMMVGNGFHKLATRALPQDRLPDACDLQNLVDEMRQQYAQHMMEATEPYPGMTQTLAQLQAQGHILAVLSNKPHEMTKPIIAHYFPEIDFAVVRGAMPDVPLKPNPTAVNEILKDIGLKTSEIFYVGDSNVDMETAANANIIGIGAGWGFRGPFELEEAGANMVLTKPEQLLKMPAKFA